VCRPYLHCVRLSPYRLESVGRWTAPTASSDESGDELTGRIARASTPEEIEQLSKQVDGLTSDYQKRINEVVAETKRLEKQSRKQ
jgi:hypothetical protein